MIKKTELKNKYGLNTLEIRQYGYGRCDGLRYNGKTSVTERCQHREECGLFKHYVFVQERNEKFGIFEATKDYVCHQPIRLWRKCQVWKVFNNTSKN